MSATKDGIHIKPATIIAVGVFAVVMLPSAWVGYKIGQATAGPDGKPPPFTDSLKAAVSSARRKAGI